MRAAQLSIGVAFLALVGVTQGAELRINWEGLGEQRTIDLAVGESAVIEVWMDLNAGDTLSGVYFANEPLDDVVQVSNEAVPAGWNAGGINGVFGPGDQQFAVAAGSAEAVIDGPGSFLVGRQTIKLDSGTVGVGQDVAISLQQPGVLTGSGSFYTRVASDSPSADEPSFYHIGAGSPGYSQLGIADERDPLIISVVSSGNANDNVNDNTNTNDNVNDNANDNTNTNDNVNDNVNDNTNDNVNDNVNDNTNDNVNDNSNDNVNDNANDNTNANDNANDNVNDNTNTNANDNTNANTNGNANDNSSEPPSGGGLCGMGAVSMTPVMFLGLLLMQAQRRRGR